MSSNECVEQVPSREAVEKLLNCELCDGEICILEDSNLKTVVRTLLAEVERLKSRCRIATSLMDTLKDEVERLNTHAERLSRINREVLAESELLSATVAQLERTVADQAAALAERDKDAERVQFLDDCVMNHGGIHADRDRDAYVDSPTFGPLPTVTLFTVPSQHVKGLGLRAAIDAALAASVSTQEKPK